MIQRKLTNRLIFHSSNGSLAHLKSIYHRLILRSGNIAQGISIKKVFGGYYEDSIHVCFKGNFDKSKPTSSQIESAGCIYHQLSRAYNKSLKIECCKIGKLFNNNKFIRDMIDYDPFYCA